MTLGASVFRAAFRAGLLGTLLWSVQLTAGVYKWVDKNGKTHYSDRPTSDSGTAQEILLKKDEVPGNLIRQISAVATGDVKKLSIKYHRDETTHSVDQGRIVVTGTSESRRTRDVFIERVNGLGLGQAYLNWKGDFTDPYFEFFVDLTPEVQEENKH